jgi:hypothetical protein
MNDRTAAVLNALLRLARRRIRASPEELQLRLLSREILPTALAELASAGLVESLPDGTTRLTWLGFAIAVAGAKRRPFVHSRARARSVRRAA